MVRCAPPGFTTVHVPSFSQFTAPFGLLQWEDSGEWATSLTNVAQENRALAQITPRGKPRERGQP